MHVEALISLKISTGKGWKTLVYTWNHLEIYWCFFRLRLSFVCLISFRHVLYLCTRIMVYNQWEILCAFRENWNELQYSLHHMKQSSRKQRTWERMAPKPCSHFLSKPTRGKWISYSWASPISRNVLNIAVCEDSEEDFLNISMLKVINNRLTVEVRSMLAHIQNQNGNKHFIDKII